MSNFYGKYVLLNEKMRMIQLFSWAGIYTLLISCFQSNQIKTKPQNIQNNMPLTSFYSLQSINMEGKLFTYDLLKGKKIVVLNTASKCGYTPQFADWQAFYEKNKDQVEILGFPCNQFLSQDPGTNQEIESFCQKNYGVTFKMFEKVDVKGKEQSIVYQWLTDKSKNGWNEQVPTWNFCKYVINEKGELTHFFGPGVKPTDKEFLLAIGL